MKRLLAAVLLGLLLALWLWSSARPVRELDTPDAGSPPANTTTGQDIAPTKPLIQDRTLTPPSAPHHQRQVASSPTSDSAALSLTGQASPWPPAWDESLEATIVVAVHDGFEWQQRAEVELTVDGSFGPVALQVDEGASLRASIRGGDIVRAFTDVVAGPPGTTKQLTLPVEQVPALRLAAVDDKGERKTDAWFELTTGHGRGAFTIRGEADDSAVAVLRGLPTGRFEIVAGAPGWATSNQDAVEIPRDTADLHILPLMPAGRVEGRVLDDGLPVRDFTITSWASDWPNTFTEVTFRDREDGSFVLENSELGWLRFTATVPTGRGSTVEEAYVWPTQETTTTVEITMRDGLEGHGRVIAGEDGSPIEGALVRVFFPDGNEPVAPSRVRTRTDEKGEFSLAAALNVDSLLSIEAPTRARAWARGTLAPDGTLDFGLTTLHPAQVTRVFIDSPEPLPVGIYRLRVTGAEVSGMHPFPPSGELLLNGFSPGRNEFELIRPRLSLMTVAQDLRPGTEWTVRIPAEHSRALKVQLTGISPTDDVSEWGGSIVGTGPDGTHYETWRSCEEDGTLIFDPLPTGNLVVEVLTPAPELKYRRVFVVEADDEDLFFLAELQASHVLVRVTSRGGEPSFHARVTVLGEGSETPAVGITDTRGETTLFGIPPGTARISLNHTEHGSQSGLEAEVLPQGLTELEFQFPLQRPFDVRAVRRGVPVPGLALELRTVPGNDLVGSRQTDAEGRVTFPRTAAGRYALVNPGDQRTWGESVPVDVEGDEEFTFEPTFLGSLNVQFVDGEGTPIPDQVFALRHEVHGQLGTNGASASPWKSSTGGLVTDGSGEVLLEGIPEGVYVLSVTGVADVWSVEVLAETVSYVRLEDKLETSTED